MRIQQSYIVTNNIITLHLPHKLSQLGGLMTVPVRNHVLIGLLGCIGGLFSVSLVATALVSSGFSVTQAVSLVTSVVAEG